MIKDLNEKITWMTSERSEQASGQNKRTVKFFALYTSIEPFHQLLHEKKWHQPSTKINCNLFSKLSKKTFNSVLMKLYNSITSLVRHCLSESKIVLYIQMP